MVKRITVPSRHRDTLERLATLDGEEWDALLASLKPLADDQTPGALTQAVAKSMQSPDQGRILIDALTGLESLRVSYGWTLDDAAEGVGQSDALELDDAARNQLTSRVSVLLAIPLLYLSSKVTSLQGEYGAIFQACRLIEDIRPVFGELGSEPPLGAIISNTLVIDYTSSTGEFESMYFTLDETDLGLLKAAVDRAYDKLAVLKQWLADTGLRELGLEEDS